MSPFGKRLKTIRTSKNKYQKELAELLGVTIRQYQRSTAVV